MEYIKIIDTKYKIKLSLGIYFLFIFFSKSLKLITDLKYRVLQIKYSDIINQTKKINQVNIRFGEIISRICIKLFIIKYCIIIFIKRNKTAIQKKYFLFNILKNKKANTSVEIIQ